MRLVHAGLSLRDAQGAMAAMGLEVDYSSISRWIAAEVGTSASALENWLQPKMRELAALLVLRADRLFELATEAETGKDAQGYAIAGGVSLDKAQAVAGATGEMRPRYGSAPQARIVMEGSAVSSDARDRIRAALAAPADPPASTDVSSDSPPSTDGT